MQMEQLFGHERYWSIYFEDLTNGCSGFHLHCERFGKTKVVAKVVFWDAAGHFAVQTIDGDVPVEVLEAVIAEAKQNIRLR
jgi:hypothetical protein